MCSSGRWKGERGVVLCWNGVYLLLTVEVQSQSEQRLLVPFIHFSDSLTLFFFPFLFTSYDCFFLYDFFVFIFLGRVSIGRGGAFYSNYLFFI